MSPSCAPTRPRYRRQLEPRERIQRACAQIAQRHIETERELDQALRVAEELQGDKALLMTLLRQEIARNNMLVHAVEFYAEELRLTKAAARPGRVA